MKLRKELGLIHVFCIASGAMISSGIFVLPGLAYAQAGPAVILSYLIAGLLATTGMLSVAELATAMPKAGGDYFFITRGMGPGVGSVAGLLTWFSLSLKTAFALVGMAAFASLFVSVDMRLLGVLLCTLFVAVNIVGAKHAGRMQVGLVVGLLLLMLLYVVRGLPAVSIMNLEPFAPHGPHSIFLTAGFVFVAYGGLLKISSVAEEACVIIMRESRIQNYQPRFRSPLYPWPQLIGIVGFSLLIFEMGIDAFFIALGLIGVGSLTYWLYGRKRVEQEFALLHLIARITSRDLVTGTLETELKQIIRERDDVVLDRFDHLVTACPVLDIEGAITKSDFFGKAAEAMADTLALAPEKIEQLLEERERQGSTVLSAHFALPHVVIKGEHRFEILLVRCSGGIHFSEESPSVRCAFVLMGTMDERNFHLNVLANIAQIVRAADFEKKWLAARGEQGLRDVVLLGERRRGS